MRNKIQKVIAVLILLGALLVAITIIYEQSRPKCDVCGEAIPKKGVCMLELYVCDDCYTDAAFLARVEQRKIMNEPYEVMDNEIWHRTYEILKEKISD